MRTDKPKYITIVLPAPVVSGAWPLPTLVVVLLVPALPSLEASQSARRAQAVVRERELPQQRNSAAHVSSSVQKEPIPML